MKASFVLLVKDITAEARTSVLADGARGEIGVARRNVVPQLSGLEEKSMREEEHETEMRVIVQNEPNASQTMCAASGGAAHRRRLNHRQSMGCPTVSPRQSNCVASRWIAVMIPPSVSFLQCQNWTPDSA